MSTLTNSVVLEMGYIKIIIITIYINGSTNGKPSGKWFEFNTAPFVTKIDIMAISKSSVLPASVGVYWNTSYISSSETLAIAGF